MLRFSSSSPSRIATCCNLNRFLFSSCSSSILLQPHLTTSRLLSSSSSSARFVSIDEGNIPQQQKPPHRDVLYRETENAQDVEVVNVESSSSSTNSAPTLGAVTSAAAAEANNSSKTASSAPSTSPSRAVNIPLCDRILNLGRSWIGASVEQQQYQQQQQQQRKEEQNDDNDDDDRNVFTPAKINKKTGTSAATTTTVIPRHHDGLILHQCSFSKATAVVSSFRNKANNHNILGHQQNDSSATVRVFMPFVVPNPSQDLPDLCRAVARLHGSALRQESRSRPIKLQQTIMPRFYETFGKKNISEEKDNKNKRRHLLEQEQEEREPEQEGDDETTSYVEVTLVSKADMIEEKIAVVTVVAYLGIIENELQLAAGRTNHSSSSSSSTSSPQRKRHNRNDIAPLANGLELIHTSAALRLFLKPNRNNLIVPEPKRDRHAHHHQNRRK